MNQDKIEHIIVPDEAFLGYSDFVTAIHTPMPKDDSVTRRADYIATEKGYKLGYQAGAEARLKELQETTDEEIWIELTRLLKVFDAQMRDIRNLELTTEGYFIKEEHARNSFIKEVTPIFNARIAGLKGQIERLTKERDNAWQHLEELPAVVECRQAVQEAVEKERKRIIEIINSLSHWHNGEMCFSPKNGAKLRRALEGLESEDEK